jgi:hypothetical protein
LTCAEMNNHEFSLYNIKSDTRSQSVWRL